MEMDLVPAIVNEVTPGLGENSVGLLRACATEMC
jgi:hypothetical protein